jgi:hypothetical protein
MVWDWLTAHDDADRRQAMLTWLAAVAIDPEMVAHGSFHAGNGRQFMYAFIPVARTVAVFVVLDVPVRAVRLIEFNDAMFEALHDLS